MKRSGGALAARRGTRRGVVRVKHKKCEACDEKAGTCGRTQYKPRSSWPPQTWFDRIVVSEIEVPNAVANLV
jgi:hypothetical protein